MLFAVRGLRFRARAVPFFEQAPAFAYFVFSGVVLLQSLERIKKAQLGFDSFPGAELEPSAVTQGSHDIS